MPDDLFVKFKEVLVKKRLGYLLLVLMISGCTSIAKIDSFEKKAIAVDFDSIENSHDSSSGFIWTWKGKNEYFFYVKKMDDINLSNQLKEAAMHYGYNVEYVSDKGAVILGKRGIRLNEWNSVLGIYSSKKDEYIRVYIKVEITQDITGGWMGNRAKSIGEYFCNQNDVCVKNLTKI